MGARWRRRPRPAPGSGGACVLAWANEERFGAFRPALHDMRFACLLSFSIGALAQTCPTSCARGTLRIGSSCSQCLDGMTCEEPDLHLQAVQLSPGYWRARNSSYESYRCFPSDHCAGGYMNGDASCLYGFTGFRCEECEGGRLFLSRSCHKCSETTLPSGIPLGKLHLLGGSAPSAARNST